MFRRYAVAVPCEEIYGSAFFFTYLGKKFDFFGLEIRKRGTADFNIWKFGTETFCYDNIKAAILFPIVVAPRFLSIRFIPYFPL